MAQIRYAEAPNVEPQTRVPDDYQHIDARPEEFGALQARGLEQFGQGLTTATKFWGKVQTDDAATTAMKAADDQVNQFRSLRGGDALNAQASTREQIENIFKQNRDNLSTPEQQYEYDSVTRNFQLRYINGVMATHADEQGKIFASQSNDSTANFHMGLISQNPNSEQVFKDNLAEVARAREKNAVLAGMDQTGIAQASAEGQAQAVAARVRAIAVADPARAQAVLENYRNVASVVDRKSGVSYYDTLANEVRGRADKINGIQRGADMGCGKRQAQRTCSPIRRWMSGSAARLRCRAVSRRQVSRAQAELRVAAIRMPSAAATRDSSSCRRKSNATMA